MELCMLLLLALLNAVGITQNLLGGQRADLQALKPYNNSPMKPYNQNQQSLHNAMHAELKKKVFVIQKKKTSYPVPKVSKKKPCKNSIASDSFNKDLASKIDAFLARPQQFVYYDVADKIGRIRQIFQFTYNLYSEIIRERNFTLYSIVEDKLMFWDVDTNVLQLIVNATKEYEKVNKSTGICNCVYKIPRNATNDTFFKLNENKPVKLQDKKTENSIMRNIKKLFLYLWGFLSTDPPKKKEYVDFDELEQHPYRFDAKKPSFDDHLGIENEPTIPDEKGISEKAMQILRRFQQAQQTNQYADQIKRNEPEFWHLNVARSIRAKVIGNVCTISIQTDNILNKLNQTFLKFYTKEDEDLVVKFISLSFQIGFIERRGRSLEDYLGWITPEASHLDTYVEILDIWSFLLCEEGEHIPSIRILDAMHNKDLQMPILELLSNKEMRARYDLDTEDNLALENVSQTYKKMYKHSVINSLLNESILSWDIQTVFTLLAKLRIKITGKTFFDHYELSKKEVKHIKKLIGAYSLDEKVLFLREYNTLVEEYLKFYNILKNFFEESEHDSFLITKTSDIFSDSYLECYKNYTFCTDENIDLIITAIDASQTSVPKNRKKSKRKKELCINKPIEIYYQKIKEHKELYGTLDNLKNTETFKKLQKNKIYCEILNDLMFKCKALQIHFSEQKIWQRDEKESNERFLLIMSKVSDYERAKHRTKDYYKKRDFIASLSKLSLLICLQDNEEICKTFEPAIRNCLDKMNYKLGGSKKDVLFVRLLKTKRIKQILLVAVKEMYSNLQKRYGDVYTYVLLGIMKKKDLLSEIL